MIKDKKTALIVISFLIFVQVLLKIEATRQVILPNIVAMAQLVLVGYLLYVLVVLFKSKERTIQILSIFVLLVFPLGFLFGIISGIDDRILIAYPVAVIAVLYLFGEYMGFKKKKEG